MRRFSMPSAADRGRLSCGNVPTHAHAHTANNANTNSHSKRISESDVCYHLKPLNVKSEGGRKVRRNRSALPADYVCAHRVPETKKLLTERKLNRSNPSVAELGRCDSDSPLRRSAPLLDVTPSRRASSPFLGGGGGGEGQRGGRGAVLLPLRAPSLPSASAWCCGSFVKQLRKTHHFD